MEERVKRSPVAALLLGVMAPGAGLLYARSPLQAMVCLLGFICILVGDRLFGILGTPTGMGVGLCAMVILSVYSLAGGVYLSGRGLSRSQVEYDLGLWVVGFLFCLVIIWPLLADVPYRSFAVRTGHIEGLQSGDFFIARNGDFDSELLTLGKAPVEAGRIVVTENDGNVEVVRLLGLPGDLLELREGRLFRNNQRMQVPAGLEAGLRLPVENGPFLVPPKAIFVWKDRASGPGLLLVTALAGQALYIYWSDDWARIGTILH